MLRLIRLRHTIYFHVSRHAICAKSRYSGRRFTEIRDIRYDYFAAIMMRYR